MRGALYAGAIAAAALSVAPAFAAYTASGVVFDSNFVTGAKAGLGDSVATIQTTLNNAFLVEVAILFIGLAVVVGLIMGVVKGHRRI